MSQGPCDQIIEALDESRRRCERLEREVRAWREYHRLQFLPYRNRPSGYIDSLRRARCERNAARADNESCEHPQPEANQ